eukprot:CAMPEP_0171896582 /NCGR_PEP_ID=MMETSP0992-20121227/47649_1 /TAXON_ID=483369 /ORGANISM="non described non described, Strain CCMP2098" /LENGTH=180 /DNA_ID=CAMNT_0012524593 /DNA_START=179 /DNA_END=719 /DNA_ORIENTATION=-
MVPLPLVWIGVVFKVKVGVLAKTSTPPGAPFAALAASKPAARAHAVALLPSAVFPVKRRRVVFLLLLAAGFAATAVALGAPRAEPAGARAILQGARAKRPSARVQVGAASATTTAACRETAWETAAAAALRSTGSKGGQVLVLGVALPVTAVEVHKVFELPQRAHVFEAHAHRFYYLWQG